MHGSRVLWLPGCDHAGIATQSVVEKELMRTQGLSRTDLGRELFLKQVWNWKDRHSTSIFDQLKRLGCSVDWSREVFTMDNHFSTAVTEAFVQLHDRGLMVRRDRLVNWSCALQSAISDIEVDSMALEGTQALRLPGYETPVKFGIMYEFAYQVEGCAFEGGEELVVATTRPETMLGDVAVAIHPDDARYSHLHGKHVVHPFTGATLPIVLDAVLVDPEFGTGAVKITPAHDANDFEVGKRHGLPTSLTVIDDDGNMTADCGASFAGVPRFDARERVVDQLKELGLYKGDREHAMVVPICSRSGDVIEPKLCAQWYLDCKDMAGQAMDAVKAGDLELIPSRFNKTWSQWLDHTEDWCVSRQLWWGHQIPAYRVVAEPPSCSTAVAANGSSSESGNLDRDIPASAAETWVCARSEEEAKVKAAALLNVNVDSIILEQDQDVLDTWFSSGLFPFASLGWPETTPDFNQFFPGDLLETGHDILFFWVARMVMLSLELTGKLPFTQVYLHAMVRDEEGKKMSKSRGNVINPLDVIDGASLEELQDRLQHSNLDRAELKRSSKLLKKQFPRGIPECGSDALRVSLVSGATQAQDVNFDIARIVSYSNFGNKLWNAFRFAEHNFNTLGFVPASKPVSPRSGGALADRWLSSRLAATCEDVDVAFAEYDFAGAVRAVQSFWLQDLCDVYFELVKPELRVGGTPVDNMSRGHAPTARQLEVAETMYTAMDAGIRLLAPLMPFLSETLYAHLRARNTSAAATANDANAAMQSVCTAEYPYHEYIQWRDLAAEEDMEALNAVARAIRTIPLKQLNSKAAVHAVVIPDNASAELFLLAHTSSVQTLARATSVTVLAPGSKVPGGTVAAACLGPCDVHLEIRGHVKPADVAAEANRLEKKCAGLQKSHAKVLGRTQGARYANASAKVHAADQETLAKLQGQINDIKAAVNVYRGIEAQLLSELKQLLP